MTINKVAGANCVHTDALMGSIRDERLQACRLAQGCAPDDVTWQVLVFPGKPGHALLEMCSSTMQDASDEFNAIHSTKAKNMLEDFYIGELDVDAAQPKGDHGYLFACTSLCMTYTIPRMSRAFCTP